MKLPPPAIELRAPSKNPARNKQINLNNTANNKSERITTI